LGAPALIAHLHELAEHVDGVRAGQQISMPIHDMRVASRRLRSGLAIFDNCLPAKKVKRWKEAVSG
jgi:CHAD domain-containing protein